MFNIEKRSKIDGFMQAEAEVQRIVMENFDSTNEWTTIPKTKIKYRCKQQPGNDNFYFDYTTDETKPSTYFTKNIKEIVIECNEDG